MHMYKNKKYWILMPPFLLLAVLLILYLPTDLKPYSIISVLIFWVTYYIWNYADKKQNNTQK